MSYLSAKKIYPGNFTEALNGWYKNVDTTDSGSNDKSVGGPTSVLAVPGYRYFQQRGYAQITGKVVQRFHQQMSSFLHLIEMTIHVQTSQEW